MQYIQTAGCIGKRE